VLQDKDIENVYIRTKTNNKSVTTSNNIYKNFYKILYKFLTFNFYIHIKITEALFKTLRRFNDFFRAISHLSVVNKSKGISYLLSSSNQLVPTLTC